MIEQPRVPNNAESGGADAAMPSMDRITRIRKQIEHQHGCLLDDRVVQAVVALGDYYRRLSAEFMEAGINEIKGAARDGGPALAPPQIQVLDANLSRYCDEIEQLSQRLATAAALLPRNLEVPVKEDKIRAAHAEFSQAALHPQLFESPFANWVAHGLGGKQGGVVSIAILLADPFLRRVISQMPELTEYVAQNPLSPKTLTGLVIEKSLLSVPVALDHVRRLDDLASFQTSLIRSPSVLGLPQTAPLVFNNIAVGTGSEIAEVARRFAGHPAMGNVTFNMLDANPGALRIAQARIYNALLGYPPGAARPDCNYVPVDVTSFLPLLPENGGRLDALQGIGKACCSVAAGIDDYLDYRMRRALNLAIALTLEPGGFGIKTKVLHHPHEHQQELLIWWRIRYCDDEMVWRLGADLKMDLDALRKLHGPHIVPFFAGKPRRDLCDSGNLCRKPGLLLPGEFCVPLTQGRTNAFLAWRMDTASASR